MAVTSKPTKSAGPRTPLASVIGWVGDVLLVISVGPLFFLLNGGFSIVGMAWLCGRIGGNALLFWSLATYWIFDVPIAARAGLPTAQPVLPWVFVLGVSCLETSLFVARRRHERVGLGQLIGGAAAALFDYFTTAIGLALLPWLAGLPVALWWAWAVVAFMLAVPLTFGFEGIMARVVPEG